jgi:uncharacterized membrane protein
MSMLVFVRERIFIHVLIVGVFAKTGMKNIESNIMNVIRVFVCVRN